MKIKPSLKHLLVRICDFTNPNSGLVLPEDVRTNPYGEVLAVGDDIMEYKVGDKLLFLPNGIIEFSQDGERVFIINEGCILGQYIDAPIITLN